MGTLRKKVRNTIGEKNYNRLKKIYKISKPKIKTDKPVAFLFGFSKWKRPHTRSYLDEYEVVFVEDNLTTLEIISEVKKYRNKVFMVWGYKQRTKIYDYAKKNYIPFYRIEDGFIRSVQLGAEHSVPMSMCVDSKALYYDATEPSDLEDILNNYDFESDKQLIERANKGIKALKDLQISKYNNVSQKNVTSIYGEKKRKRVLVIGQVEDDQSIMRGCSTKINNNELVWIAKTENPDAQIIYKPHPDVLFGKRTMQSNPDDVKHISQVVTEPLSLTDALETIDHVFTITSLAGFEALLRGIKVTTIGAPFYSGWGLTDDRQKVDRRKRKLSIEEVFAAAYILYPKYMHPFTKKKISMEEAIETLKVMRDINLSDKADNDDSFDLLIGVPDEYKRVADVFFNRSKAIFITGNELLKNLKALLRKHTVKRAFVWNDGDSNIKEVLINYMLEEKLEIFCVNKGLINDDSIGQGNNKLLSIQFEKNFMLHGPNHQSELIDLLNNYNFGENKKLIIRATGLINLLKGNLNQKKEFDYNLSPETKEKKEILILGHNDSTPLVSNLDLVWFAKTENPDAKIIFKVSSNSLTNISTEVLEEIKEICEVNTDSRNSINDLDNVEKVYTYDSSEALNALFKGIPVITLGKPFYAGWGLTDDKAKIQGRKRNLTIEELVAVAYILYPKYMNPFTNEEISAESAVVLKARIEQINNKMTKINHNSHHVEENKNSSFALTKYGSTSNDEGSCIDLDIKGEIDSNIGILSKGIQAIPNLQSFLKGNVEFNPMENTETLDFIAGWGFKPSAEKAIKFAKEHEIPYLGLEDGFLRSVGLGVDGSPTLSICIDDIGIYYDATKPSRLENILNSEGWITEELLNSAKRAMKSIKDNYLSKYNHAPKLRSGVINGENGREKILVVDQTLGDMSITLGLADKQQFEKMYRVAVADNPKADIFIKTHPDVISGKKKGNITDMELSENTTVIYEDCNPISLIEQVNKVYVVTSQFGFEALMLGKEVHCFGVPFYAGWGVTKDRLSADRRKKLRTVEEIFAAAYILYPRYIDPNTGLEGTIFDVIDYISRAKKAKNLLLV